MIALLDTIGDYLIAGRLIASFMVALFLFLLLRLAVKE